MPQMMKWRVGKIKGTSQGLSPPVQNSQEETDPHQENSPLNRMRKSPVLLLEVNFSWEEKRAEPDAKPHFVGKERKV